PPSSLSYLTPHPPRPTLFPYTTLFRSIAGVDTFKLYDREHLVIDDAEGTSLKTDLTLFTSVRSMRIQSTWSLKQGKGSSEWRRAGRVEPWLLPLRVLLLHRHAR